MERDTTGSERAGPPAGERAGSIRVVDAEAGGDVCRVVVDGLAPPPGAAVQERARGLANAGSALRDALLAGEVLPAALDIVVPATHPVAEAGFVPLHPEGMRAFAGTDAMAVAAALIAAGRLRMPAAGQRALVLEAPGGPVTLSATRDGDALAAVDLVAEPAFLAGRGLRVVVPGYGDVSFDLVYGGRFFAVLDGAALGLAPDTAAGDGLARLGAALVEAVRPGVALEHPLRGDLGPLSFALIVGERRETPDGPEVPLATVAADGTRERGPGAEATAALLARLAVRGAADAGTELTTVSPAGHRLRGRITRVTDGGAESVVTAVPRVEGTHVIEIDPDAIGPNLAPFLAGAGKQAE